MVVKVKNLSPDNIAGLREMYPEVREIEGGVEIKAKELIFEEIVDYIRSKGTKIEWISMKEPSLDDVFLKLTGKKVKK